MGQRVIFIRTGLADATEATDQGKCSHSSHHGVSVFRERFISPVGVMLLSLKYRKIDDGAILDGVRSIYTGKLWATTCPSAISWFLADSLRR